MEEKRVREIDDLEKRAQYYAGIFRAFACSMCVEKIMSKVPQNCEKNCGSVYIGAVNVIEELLDELRRVAQQPSASNDCTKFAHAKDDARPKYAPSNANRLINDEIWQFKNLKYGHKVPRKPWFESIKDGDWVCVSRSKR